MRYLVYGLLICVGPLPLGFLVGFTVVLPVAFIASTVAVTVQYHLCAKEILLRTGTNHFHEHGTKYPHYLVGMVWLDWLVILTETASRIRLHGRRILRSPRGILSALGFNVWLTSFLLPLSLAMSAGVALSAVPLAVVFIAHAAAYIAVVLIGTALRLGLALVLGLIEWPFRIYRRINQTCQHSECCARFTLPVYACPRCDVRHPALKPDLYGVFRHVCLCGGRLPTATPLGRHRLPAYCPSCSRALPPLLNRQKPWKVHGRPKGKIPLNHVIFSRAIFVGSPALSVGALVPLGQALAGWVAGALPI
ncbi:hypothetical protein [Rhizohabitans arisaemae]|uniref:hypothetical protein n=1 Tax=Rhizohabitans arisaemae TaxID=2720610 RepID=UPI0024B20EF5|nr:hypothetical protein [Rhizohabitans arisaemae]